ncbi:MAG: FKBP-type peptidyl-prolyl cis-trans isomerase [Bacteroidia bacterium]|nr:FKBP-type peptidyl-prolyl cis-trans isomerase [Bacteroidia bacterium]
MKSIYYSFFTLLLLVFAGCDDIPTFDEQLAIDKQIIEDYIAEKGLVGQWTENSVFYVLEDEGIGTEYPTTSSSIDIIYSGTFLDGEEFDSSGGFPVTFNVYSLIRGWQEGIQEFKKESKGILIIPSGLAYGPNGTFGIPADAVIRFDIELLDFN